MLIYNRVPLSPPTYPFDSLQEGEWYKNGKNQIGRFHAGEIRYTHYLQNGKVHAYSKATRKNPMYHQSNPKSFNPCEFTLLGDPEFLMKEQRRLEQEKEMRMQADHEDMTKKAMIEEAYTAGHTSAPEIEEYVEREYNVILKRGTIAPYLANLNKCNSNHKPVRKRRNQKIKTSVEKAAFKEVTIPEVVLLMEIAETEFGSMERLLQVIKAYQRVSV